MDSDNRKRGRPRKSDGKLRRVEVRLTEEKARSLDEICEKTGKNKTKAIEEALRMYGNLVNFRG